MEDLSFFHEEYFKKNLALYEQMQQGGRPVYLEADELTDIAEYYLIKNRRQEAMKCIQYALELHPDSVDPMIFLARQRMFNGDMEGAKKIRDSITDQNDREVIFLNAELFLRERKADMAHLYLKQKAEDEEEELAIFAYDCACLFIDYEVWEYAEQWNEIALKMEPENDKFLIAKAEILLATHSPRRAVTILNRILDNDPYNLTAWHTLGEAYFASEDYSRTLETIEFALAIDEHDDYAMLLKANCHFHLQDFEKAHRLYTRYLKECPANEIPYLFDGICLLSLGANEEALSQLLRAEEISQGYSPDQQHIYINIAEAYSALKQPDKAFEYINKVMEVNPEYDIDLFKGHILMENGRREEGLIYYDLFVRQHDNLADAHFFTAVSLVENKEYDEARKHFLEVVRHSTPDNEKRNKINAYLAFCALMQNKYEEFLTHLEQACHQDPDSLELTIGKFIPDEVPPQDFYQYVLTHPDRFIGFNPDRT